MNKKTCDFCSKGFLVHAYRSGSAHFCSTKCYNNHRKNKAYKKICPQCNKEFTNNRITRNRKYCGDKCSMQAIRKYDRKDKTCPQCKKTFKYSSRNPRQIFCSNQCNVKSRAYAINENFFDKINSEGKAYLLGLVFADGSLSEKNYINISSNDRKLIKMCRKVLDSNACIHNYNKSYSLIFRNKKLATCLRKWGVLERKSWKDYSIPQIPKTLLRHYLRGFFDGDGSFYISNHKKYKYLCASFTCNSKQFLEDVKKEIERNKIKAQDIRYDRKPNNTGSWQLRIARRESIERFANYLYKNGNYFLDRKYQIVQKFYGRKI